MTEENNVIEKALSISKSCLFPDILEDIDAHSIRMEDFKEYRMMQKKQLYVLMDLLHQYEIILLINKAYDQRLIQLRVNVLRIICEQNKSNPYSTDDKVLMKTLEKIAENYFPQFEDVLEECVRTFKESLRINTWKKQIGIIYSCPRICKILLEHKLMNKDNIMFFLYIGSNLIVDYDPHYKKLGLNIYRYLLKSDLKILNELNVHSVIYSEIFPLIQRSEDFKFNFDLYECLYDIVLMENQKVSNSRWCKFDDVISKLISQFSLTNDKDLSKLLIYQILKFCCIGNTDFKLQSFEYFLKANMTNIHVYSEEFKEYFNEPNHRVQRWIKKLMELMIRETIKVLSDVKSCIFILNILNLIYLSSIATLGTISYNNTIRNLTRKLILTQMKILSTFKGDQDILTSVIQFLNTIEHNQRGDKDITFCINKIKDHEMLKIKI